MAGSAALPAGAVTPIGEVTPAELRRSNPELKLTWFRPEQALAPFDRVQLLAPEISYRDVPYSAMDQVGTTTRAEFPIKEKDRAKLQQDVDKAFREELGKRGHYSLVDAAGPGVLVVKPALMDVISRVPPQRTGRSEVWLDTVGDATLVLTLVDGATGETVARAIDRRTARPVPGYGDFGALRSSAPTVWNEVRQLARSWGRAMGDRVDQLYFEAKPR